MHIFLHPKSPPNSYPDLFQSIGKLAMAGERAGFTIEEMIRLLNAGLTVEDLVDMITAGQVRLCAEGASRVILSRSAEHAINAVIYLAEQPPDKFCAAHEIAKGTGIRLPFLWKVLGQLTDARLLISSKGAVPVNCGIGTRVLVYMGARWMMAWKRSLNATVTKITL